MNLQKQHALIVKKLRAAGHKETVFLECKVALYSHDEARGSVIKFLCTYVDRISCVFQFEGNDINSLKRRVTAWIRDEKARENTKQSKSVIV